MIEYTALDSDDYRRQVVSTIELSVSAERAFSFRHELADQWYDQHQLRAVRHADGRQLQY